jgi:transposase
MERLSGLAWVGEMRTLFRKAIRLGNRREKMSENGYARQIVLIEKQTDQLLKRRFSSVGAKLLKRYRKYRDALFVFFLYRSDVPAHNNACERALRPSVIHRKVKGSFRSDWGAQACAALATVLSAAKRNGQSAFEKLLLLPSKPILSFLHHPSLA